MKRVENSKDIKEILLWNGNLEGFWIEDGVLVQYSLTEKESERAKFRIYSSRRCFDMHLDDWLTCNDITEDLLIKYLVKTKAVLVNSVEEAKRILGIITI